MSQQPIYRRTAMDAALAQSSGQTPIYSTSPLSSEDRIIQARFSDRQRRIVRISLDQVDEIYQFRSRKDPLLLENLAKQFRESNVCHHLPSVVEIAPGYYGCFGGNTRIQAARIANWTEMDAWLYSDLTAKELKRYSHGLNKDQRNLNPLDDTRALLSNLYEDLVGIFIPPVPRDPQADFSEQVEVEVEVVRKWLYRIDNQVGAVEPGIPDLVTGADTGSEATPEDGKRYVLHLLQTEYGMGFSWSTLIRNRLPLVTFPRVLQNAIAAEEITAEGAKHLAKLKDEHRIRAVLDDHQVPKTVTGIRKRVRELLATTTPERRKEGQPPAPVTSTFQSIATRLRTTNWQTMPAEKRQRILDLMHQLNREFE